VFVILAFLAPVALSVLAAYDAKLGRRFEPRRYVAAGLRSVVPLFLCWLVVMILAGLGWMLFVVPGLWVMSVFAVFAPAIVVERIGLGGLGRSVSLTKGYRWPILGAMIVTMLGAMAVGMVVAIAAALLELMLAPLVSDAGAALGMLAAIVAVMLQSLNLTVTYCLPCVGVALIYARLREIKEGTSVEALTEVFA
jgi:hypothetical protein